MLHCCLFACEKKLISSLRRTLDNFQRTPILIDLLPTQPDRQKQLETAERQSIAKLVDVSCHQY